MPAICRDEGKNNGDKAGECSDHHGELVHETHRLDTPATSAASGACRGMRHAPDNR